MIKEVYWAVKKQGAWLNNKKISVSKIKTIAKTTTTYCHGNNDKRAFKIYEHFRTQAVDCCHFGSTALEMTMVAAGFTDALMVSGPMIWDIAPGIILVKEAGGKVTDFQGQPWELTSHEIVASNKLLLPKLIKYLKKL